jgi:hypothetical protein
MRAEWPSKHIKQGARKRNMGAENTIDTRYRQTNHPCTQTHTPNHQEQQRVSYHQRCKKKKNRVGALNPSPKTRSDQNQGQTKKKKRTQQKTDKNSSRCPFSPSSRCYHASCGPEPCIVVVVVIAVVVVISSIAPRL